jgi:hypothetical protein
MLPASYELPAALLITAGGVIACIAGYRLFRIVLAIYGFVLGAVIASSIVGPTNTLGMIGAALGGGLAGALTLVFAYFAGIALVGGALGALLAHAAWTQFGSGDPPALLIIGAAVAGAVTAMFLQRYVIVVSTAFGGAWTIIVGLMAIVGGRSTNASVWILYPTTPTESRWTLLAWVALGVAGTAVQLAVTARTKR